MKDIKLETITPVHIGSGVFLNYNTDFVLAYDYDTETNEKFPILFVIDDKKILNEIGVENLDKWILSIERGENTEKFVKQCNPKSEIENYSKRILDLYGELKPNESLKEHIHDGMGHPYIPGSSIKGAIRTAVLATCVNQIENLSSKVGNLGKKAAGIIEEELFGKMQNDIFRFLRIGDAIFEDGCEIAVRLNMGLNITHQESLVPKGDRKPQVTEVINSAESTTLKMTLDDKILSMHNLPKCMTSMKNLFEAINEHTQKLIKREINFWEDLNEDHTGAELYVKKLNYVLNRCIECNENQCILRVGHGSGWDFITGGWAKELENFEEVVVPASRPFNYRYEEYPFPKSRKFDTDNDILGFVKLTIL